MLKEISNPLIHFHPITKKWFEEKLGKPTESQIQAWPAIQEGRHTLISAPTGSGKTLAAFYAAIDQLVKRSLKGDLPQTTQIVYVSPLKALSNDIHKNLEVPLNGIEQLLHEQHLPSAGIKVAVRTGDTTPKERQQMLKHPPHILVTTPESLYLLLTSVNGREMLKSVHTLIIDEIHALLGDKRGSHLSLSVERLSALTEQPLQRIGLSATQKPIDLVARFLVGNKNIKDGHPDCMIVDTGYRRTLDLHLEVPRSPLSAVMSNEVWGEIHTRLTELIQQHRTTLIFVNTRRLAERLSLALADRIGEEHVSSHHGSMSKEHRHLAEQKLKNGQLKVLVATASMELGIDIGSVELVVQFSSPKRIAAFLQRVGRSGHTVGGTPKGILFALSRNDLLECTALLDSVRRGELDHIIMPEQPMDILSQQIVAEVAGQEWDVKSLYDLFHNAYPYRNLTHVQFLTIIHMLAEGYTTRRGRRGTYLHYDAVNGHVRARRGARLIALTNGGAIPDTFDYEVVLQPEGITVGTLNEDFALESLAGDIFNLGNHAWRLVRIEGLKVIVHDAAGQPPSVPFWLGEGPGRSDELSEAVTRLKETISSMLDEDPLPGVLDPSTVVSFRENQAVKWLINEVKISEAAAEQLVIYLWMGKIGLGVMPTHQRIVLERFFDEAGDMHLVIHSPYGSRVNKAWGLALRKKFCRNFNFELQAAADENSIILSLSSSHSFELESVSRYLNTKTVRETLVQAMLDAPLFEIRWRWNATRALATLRNRNGKRVPPYLQRMQAEDLIAQVFPDQIACAENIVGERQIPDHPLVNQVIKDCLTEAMDIETLEDVIGKIERKEIEIVAKDLREPSVFAQEIINARPYSFLDDTEFAERRVNAIKNRGWLDPGEAKDLSKLDIDSINRVKEEAWPEARDFDELHDVLMIHGFITDTEGQQNKWNDLLNHLIETNRATRLIVDDEITLWIAAERIPLFKMIYPQSTLSPSIPIPEHISLKCSSTEDALKEIFRGRLEALGPVTEEQLIKDTHLSKSHIQFALGTLEQEGFVFRGQFTPDLNIEEWCERRLLQRIHKYTIESLRESIQPVSVQDFMRFLFSYHGMELSNERSGPESLQHVLSLLEGFEAPAASWESDLIPSRMADYDPSWLDVLCMSGKIVWGRFHPPQHVSKSTGPIKSTPINLVPRGNVQLWRTLVKAELKDIHLSHIAEMILEHLNTRGADFFDDIVSATSLLKSQVETGIAELVSNGLIVSDSYAGLRALLTPQYNKPSQNGLSSRLRKDREALFGIEHAGRWSIVPHSSLVDADNWDYETLDKIIQVYLRRWGVLFRSLIEKESFAPPWRILVRVLRRMELRGELRGGRFVSQVSGEQFALPSTIDQLRAIKKKQKNEELISISAADPLNLVGIILPGKRVSTIASNRIVFREGIPLAVLEAKEIKYLQIFPTDEQWNIQKALVRRKFPPKLRYYLGKNYV
jgi:ATP-dependent Lhr-like helicase